MTRRSAAASGRGHSAGDHLKRDAGGDGQHRKEALPPKEKALFEQAARLHDTRQLKKALKISDQILRRVPDHGETLALRALVLAGMGQREEAHALVHRALRQDVRSSYAWRMLALMHRQGQELREAGKAYQQVVRLEPDAVDALRELVAIQLHLRELEGALATQQRLVQVVQLRAGAQSHWMTLAIINHLLDRHEEALQTLDAWDRASAKQAAVRELAGDREVHTERVHLLELRLRFAECCDDAARKRACVERYEKHPEQYASVVLERVARLYEQLERVADAERCYRALLRVFPENAAYFEGLRRCVSPEVDTASLYRQVAAACRESEAQWRLAPLACCRGLLEHLPADDAELDALAGEMLERFLEASVPSLFAVLEPLYRDEAKVAVIERHLQEARRREHRHAEALSLLEAQHVFRRSGDRERALAILERHPESLECHEARARLLYASGAYRPAYEAADAARRLDLRDRAINSLTVEYALRAGEIERATELIAAFTHDGELPTNQALYNLQVIWFELARGDAYWREQRLDRALKNYTAVLRHFDDFRGDELFCETRYAELVAHGTFIDTVRWQDRLFTHEHYVRAVCGAVRCYCAVQEGGEAVLQRLAQLRLTASGNHRGGSEARKPAKRAGSVEWAEDDPDGEQLVRVEDPLLEAQRLLMTLLQRWPADTPVPKSVLELLLEVALRRGKWVLALHAVYTACGEAQATGELTPGALEMLRRLLRAWDRKGGQERDVLTMEVEALRRRVDVSQGVMTADALQPPALSGQKSIASED
ncbi:hypothetical protein CDCA_CDCA16G4116 [Cyanidium caldarium]|uniref:Uncharacterized protein n=1 Tax=Cyanidium caldarium TaxID=2771 RepID=A0AAV9J1D9_CYACA|nr:hypothetical protein CDCA_CDCA16G4116 [Cyanidium caldarium]